MLTSGRPKRAVRGGHHQVAGQDDLEAAAERRALDGGDERACGGAGG